MVCFSSNNSCLINGILFMTQARSLGATFISCFFNLASCVRLITPCSGMSLDFFPLSVQVVSWALILPLILLPGLLLLQAASHSFAKCYDLSRALAAPSPGPIWKLISLPMLSHTGVWEKTWAVESDHSWPKAQLSHHWPGTPENVAEMSSTSVPLICRMGNQGH